MPAIYSTLRHAFRVAHPNRVCYGSFSMTRLAIALLVTATFALLGWGVGGVTLGGAAVGLLVAFVLYYGIGAAAFVVLVEVFVITWITTRLGHSRKQRLGVAERRQGRRTAGQVAANLGVSGAFAALVLLKTSGPLSVLHIWPFSADAGFVPLITAAIAALAEAAADTSSSECGEAFCDAAYLFPQMRSVPAGTDGAITVIGTLAGIAASMAIAALAFALHILAACAAAVVAASGIFGMLIDTVLGATLERCGLMNNNAVNFFSTLAAALLALTLACFFSCQTPSPLR
jgi:uncharacterized protein (TIGR00297 family)